MLSYKTVQTGIGVVSCLGLSSFAPWIVGRSLNVSNGKVYSIWQHSKILVILAAVGINLVTN
jgi:hypothetical protein